MVLKRDGGKPRMDLIPPEAIEALADILSHGAEEYSERDWETGARWGRYFAALMRHMWAWWAGQDLDPKSGRSHLWHALACVAFLVTYEKRKIGEDDRVKHGSDRFKDSDV